MSGSAARRYLINEQTQEFLSGSSASAILNNLKAGAFGEVGDEAERAPIESRPVKQQNQEDEMPALPSEDAVGQDKIEAQLSRMNMRGQQYSGLLEPEAVDNVIPFPGGQQQGMDPSVNGENLAESMDTGRKTDLGNRVRQTTALDDQSRQEWLQGYDKALELVDYQSKIKNYPIEGAANIKYPLLVMASLQFAARAYPAIVRPGNMVRMKVEGFEPEAPDPREMDPAKASTPDGIREIKLMMLKSQKSERASRVSRYMSWQLRSHIREWEEETDKLLHTLPLTGCTFRKTYQSASGRKRSILVNAKDVVVSMKARSIEEAPRITQKFTLYPYELQTKIKTSEYLDIREELNLDYSNDEDNQKPINFLEQHTRYDLDEDGYDEPVVITVHEESGTVCRIENNYDQGDIRVGRDGSIVEIIPTQIFTKYDFLPNPLGGIYGVGFGHILRDITDSINTTLNQIFDAAHLQNSAGGFLGKGLRFGRAEQGEQLHVNQNRYHYVNATGMDLRTQIVPFEHKGPSPVLFQVLGLLIEAGRDIASIKDILTGDTAGSSNLPVGTTLALIEQGMQVFTAIYKRVFRSLSREFSVLYQLNGKHLDIDEYMIVTDDPRATEQDFDTGDHDLTPVSDPNVVTDMQKLGRAQYLQQFLNDPMLNRRAIYKRIFNAASIEDPEELYAPPDMIQEQLAMLQLESAVAQKDNVVADTKLKEAQSIKNLSDASETRVGVAFKDREFDQKDREIDVKEQTAKRASNGSSTRK